MPVFSERRRLASVAEREAAGENLWTIDIDTYARRRIAVLFEDEYQYRYICDAVSQLLEAQTGVPLPRGRSLVSNLVAAASTGRFFDILEAVYSIKADLLDHDPESMEEELGSMEAHINGLLRSYRVSYTMVDGEFVPFTSDELHQSVVVPALRLLVTEKYADAHASYLKALREIQNGDAPDAITDAGTALEHMLKALGCDGNSLGARWAAVKKNGFVGGHDDNLFKSISSAMDWASAQRSTRGDAHTGAAETTLDDAWLTVHIVGALIVRLSRANPANKE